MKNSEETNDPNVHYRNIKEMLQKVAAHAREDVSRVNDPKAQALFETTAEVITGLIQAYDHAESRSEKAWE